MSDCDEGIRSEENNQQRPIHNCAIQMYIYLLCRLCNLFETEAINKQKNQAYATTAKRGRKVLFEHGDDEFMDRWVMDRERIVTVIQRLLSLTATDSEGKTRRAAVKFLWAPAIVCSNFMRTVKEVAYKFLENPEFGKSSGREWLRTIFEYLRVICINFDEFQKIGSKLVGLMKKLEYLSSNSLTHSPFVDAIEACSVNYDMDPLFMAILTSFSRLTPSDFSKTDVSARPFALFITSLAEKKPRLLNRHIVNIAFFLSNDPVTLRSAVLTAFVEIIVEVYKGNLPEGSHRRARDRLLLRLQDHIMDVNAVVRSRALQLWTRLARCAQIPLVFIHNGLIRDISSRLLDKSIYVRKNAAVFLATFLEFNPFGPTLCADELAKELSRLQTERIQLKKSNPEYDSVKAAMNEWSTVQNQMLKCIENAISEFESEQQMSSNKQQKVSVDDDERTERESGTSSSDGVFTASDSSKELFNQLNDSGMEVDDVKNVSVDLNNLLNNIPNEQFVICFILILKMMDVIIQLLHKNDSRRVAAKLFTQAVILNRIPFERYIFCYELIGFR
ncbi:unnamed protein product [Anisakis simplex]|uniref:Condensin complex subunit 1 (inferred by orthology to a C. elegans protein) n=1 Tax=Anisakis simplex TaxID=6269 RepID=A0A0M3KCK4_ANISI|nr:unnamed protein product [Anisakis simplex]